MKTFLRNLAVLGIFICLNQFSYSQTNQKIVGAVVDSVSIMPLQNVNIILSNNKFSTSTDKSGNFIIKDIPSGNYQISFTYLGYCSKRTDLNIKTGETKIINIKMTQIQVSLGDIIVTSTRTQKVLREISLPVAVLDRQEILSNVSATPADLFKKIPGISLERDGIWAATVNIRGLSRNDFLILIDGNRIETASEISAALSLVDLNDVDKIEVIKGGASSLYGSGALGGIVNFISKTPHYSDGFNINGNLNSKYNSVNSGTSQNLSLNLFSEFWNLRLNGTLRNAADTKTPLGKLGNSQFHDNNFSSVLSIKTAENQDLKINYQRYYGHDIGISGGYPLFPDNADVSYKKVERDLFSGDYNINNLTRIFTKLSFKYYNHNIYRFVENVPYVIQTPDPFTQINVEKITPNARHYLNGFKLETNWVIGQSNFITAGLDIWERNLDSRRERYLKITSYDSTGQITNVKNQINGEKPLPEASYRSSGIYLQDNIILMPKKLYLTVGGRFDLINVKNKAVYNPIYIITTEPIQSTNYNTTNQTLYWNATSEHDISWSGTISALYLLVNDIDLTLNLTRSFRSPSLEERFQYIDLGSLIRVGNPNLQPEKGIFMDFGLRIWKEDLTFSGNLFLNKLTNLVAQVNGTFDNRPALINENIGSSFLYGYDCNFEYNLFSDFVLYGSGAYVRGQDIRNHLDLPSIPALNWELGFRSTILNVLNLNFNGRFTASQNRIAPGETATPGYSIYNLYLSSILFDLNITELRIFAGIENLTNKAYRNHLSTNRGLITVEPGRNYYLKLNFSW